VTRRQHIGTVESAEDGQDNVGMKGAAGAEAATDMRINADGVRLADLMRQGYVFAQDCPSREVLTHLTSRWAVLVLVGLMAGTHRFSELRRKVGGISEKMLAQTLQTLEADGFVRRVAYPVVPPKVEYHLTSMGEAVATRLEGLADWVQTHIGHIVAHRVAHGKTNDREHKPRVNKL